MVRSPGRHRTRESRIPDVGPVRTCVGCRVRAPVDDLLRVVAVDGVLVPDPRRRLPGRGAWLHPAPECLTRAERRSAFPRALRVPGPLDTDRVRSCVQAGEPPAPGPHAARHHTTMSDTSVIGSGTSPDPTTTKARSTRHEPVVKIAP